MKKSYRKLNAELEKNNSKYIIETLDIAKKP